MEATTSLGTLMLKLVGTMLMMLTIANRPANPLRQDESGTQQSRLHRACASRVKLDRMI